MSKRKTKDEMAAKATKATKAAEAPPAPPMPTGQERLERVVAFMREEGVDFRALPFRILAGMQGTFIADVMAVDTRTGRPLERG